VKPVSSIGKPQKTITSDNQDTVIINSGRFDTILVPRIIPVVEAMIKLTLADSISYQRLVKGEEGSLNDLREAIDKIDEDILIALKRRSEISSLVGQIKSRSGFPVLDSRREEQLINDLFKKAEKLGIDRSLVELLWKAIIEDSRKKQ
jgi:monofunctional chorismate mutase